MTPFLVRRPLDACGARTRAGTPCQQRKGWGTDHVGQGRCELHGGRSPIKHGLYSKILRPSLQERLLRLPAPARDLLTELSCLRAAVLDLKTRQDALEGAQHLVPRLEAAIRAIIRGRWERPFKQ